MNLLSWKLINIGKELSIYPAFPIELYQIIDKGKTSYYKSIPINNEKAKQN